MDLENLTREELIQRIRGMKRDMDNVLVFWGGRRQFRETLEEVARNEDGEYTAEEALNAATILKSDGAFEELIQLIRDSFEKGGINYAIAEKITALMDEVASRSREDTP